MSDSNSRRAPAGFSTGALEKGNYRAALKWLEDTDAEAVEISALRFDELEPTVRDLDRLDVNRFEYVSFHAPSSFLPEQEDEVLDWLRPVLRRGWNIVVHPDVIHTPAKWAFLGRQLLIENMDRRKRVGRTVAELARFFKLLPEARFCLDVAHARQLDTTLTLLFSLFEDLHDRIAEIHISELDSRCRHVPMSGWAMADYHHLPWQSLAGVPVIIESMLDRCDSMARQWELHRTRRTVTGDDDRSNGDAATWGIMYSSLGWNRPDESLATEVDYSTWLSSRLMTADPATAYGGSSTHPRPPDRR